MARKKPTTALRRLLFSITKRSIMLFWHNLPETALFIVAGLWLTFAVNLVFVTAFYQVPAAARLAHALKGDDIAAMTNALADYRHALNREIPFWPCCNTLSPDQQGMPR